MLTAPSDRRSPPPAQAQLTSERASRPPWPPRRGEFPVRPEQQSGWAFLGRRSNPGFGLFASTSIGSRRPEISGSADAGQLLADGCSAPGFALVRHAGPKIAVRNRHGTVSRFDHRSPHTHRSRNRPRQGRCPPGRAKGDPVSDLLDLALKAHGGLDRWREVKSLDVRVSLTGALYHL